MFRTGTIPYRYNTVLESIMPTPIGSCETFFRLSNHHSHWHHCHSNSYSYSYSSPAAAAAVAAAAPHSFVRLTFAQRHSETWPHWREQVPVPAPAPDSEPAAGPAVAVAAAELVLVLASGSIAAWRERHSEAAAAAPWRVRPVEQVRNRHSHSSHCQWRVPVRLGGIHPEPAVGLVAAGPVVVGLASAELVNDASPRPAGMSAAAAVAAAVGDDGGSDGSWPGLAGLDHSGRH